LFWNCLATAATGEPDLVTERLTWSPDLCVPVQLNGALVKPAIATDDAVAIDLNPDAAQRAGLVARGLEHFFGVRDTLDSIEPSVEVFGHIRAQSVQILDHPPERVSVIWHTRTQVDPNCDGSVDVWLVAAPTVSVIQAAAPSPTRNVVISMKSDRTWVPG
jgi:hypothetical protein